MLPPCLKSAYMQYKSVSVGRGGSKIREIESRSGASVKVHS